MGEKTPLDYSKRINKKLREKRQLNYLKGLKNELAEVSEKHGITPELLMEMIDELFYDVRKIITSKKMPVILLQSFGVFTPSFKMINYLLRTWIGIFREYYSKPDELPPEKYEKYLKLKEKFRRYWAVRQRFIAEKRGIQTYYCWKNLPWDLTGYEECHKPTPQNCHKCYEERK